MTHTTSEISNERLAQLLDSAQRLELHEYVSIYTELAALRRSSGEVPKAFPPQPAEDLADFIEAEQKKAWLETQNRRSASNAGRVEVKARQALAVYGKWVMDVATLGELADLEARMAAVGVTLQDVGEWSNPPSLAAEAEPVAQGSCASCNGTGDTGGNPSYGMCPDCDGTGKFPPAHPSSSVSAEVTESPWRSMDTAPLDGKHCILAVPEPGGFIYSVQGAYQDGQWNAVHRDNVQPLYWMPNILLPKKPDASLNGGRENG